MDIRNRKKLEREKLYNLFYDYKKAIKVIESMKYVSNVECTVKYCNALVRKHLYANNLVGIDKPFKRFMFYMSGCLRCKNTLLNFLTDISADFDSRLTNMNDLKDFPNPLGYGDIDSKKVNTIIQNILDLQEKVSDDNK